MFGDDARSYFEISDCKTTWVDPVQPSKTTAKPVRFGGIKKEWCIMSF